jgi:diketogulonate reductase-like aldo/keto reductase
MQRIGFGTYRLTDDNTYSSVLSALHNNYRLLDTAQLYKNEILVGNAIIDSRIDRKEIYIVVKISRNALKKKNIKASFLQSLKKLQCEYADLVLLHEPINHIHNWRLLVELYNEHRELIKNIGVSNFKDEHIQDIINETKVVPYANQLELNPFLTRIELVEQMKTRNIHIIAHSPLAKGEKLTDNKLIEIANELNMTPAQVMIQWGIQRGYCVIPRSSNEHHINENMLLNNIDTHNMDKLDKLNCEYATHRKYL